MNLFSCVVLFLSVAAIAVADVFIKKAGGSSASFKDIFLNPWFLAAAVLYIAQVVGFGFLFFSGSRLVSVGIFQTVLYALVVVGSGVLVFHESLTALQIVGVLLSITGVVLIGL